MKTCLASQARWQRPLSPPLSHTSRIPLPRSGQEADVVPQAPGGSLLGLAPWGLSGPLWCFLGPGTSQRVLRTVVVVSTRPACRYKTPESTPVPQAEAPHRRGGWCAAWGGSAACCKRLSRWASPQNSPRSTCLSRRAKRARHAGTDKFPLKQ